MTQVPHGQTDPTAASLYDWMEMNTNSGSQRHGTLQRLKQACDALIANGNDFSLRDIEAYCKKTFGKGPNAQSISNDKGLHAYVDARRNEADLQRKYGPRSPLDQDIQSIPNIELRRRIQFLVEDYNLTKKKLRIITEGLAKLVPPLNLDSILLGERINSTSDHPIQAAMPAPDQVSALKRIVMILRNPERLRRAGLNIDGDDIIGSGLRETIVEGRDIMLLEALLAKLEK